MKFRFYTLCYTERKFVFECCVQWIGSISKPWKTIRTTNLTFMWPCIVINSYNKTPTRCTNFSNLFWNETLHVSDSSSVHHQEFFTVHTATGICHTGALTACEQDQDENQIDAIISQIYFWNKILHVADSSSVRHQDFFTVHTAMVYDIQVCWQLASRIRTETN